MAIGESKVIQPKLIDVSLDSGEWLWCSAQRPWSVNTQIPVAMYVCHMSYVCMCEKYIFCDAILVRICCEFERRQTEYSVNTCQHKSIVRNTQTVYSQREFCAKDGSPLEKQISESLKLQSMQRMPFSKHAGCLCTSVLCTCSTVAAAEATLLLLSLFFFVFAATNLKQFILC